MRLAAENQKYKVTIYKTYLKNSSKTAALATIGAVGIFAFRAIQGKINGNLKNADVDHATKSQHY